MTKRQIIKTLKENYPTFKKEDNTHDLIVMINEVKTYLKIIKLTSNSIFSFNSKTVWEIKKGKISGIRFIQFSSTLLKMDQFMEKPHKAIILTTKPYKILKQLNESEISDVSNEQFVHGVFIANELLTLKKKNS